MIEYRDGELVVTFDAGAVVLTIAEYQRMAADVGRRLLPALAGGGSVDRHEQGNPDPTHGEGRGRQAGEVGVG
ncbi:MAG: hypothetical protein LLG20_18835 [Acidobacteriales bacterium]|nr:hypothetical protein [Terriglobales bacterium]